MAKGKLIVICQSGGKFTSSSDGSLAYSGGDAHALSINSDTRFDEFKSEIAEMWKHELNSMSIKYFVPNNNRTLITISSDKDIQRLIEFHEDSATVDVYVVTTRMAASDVTMTPCSRSSRTTAAEPVSPVHNPSNSAANAEDVGQRPLCRSSRMTAAKPVSPVHDPSNFGANAENVGPQKFTRSWKNSITGLDQQFNGVKDFRDALHKYSVAHGFLYTFKTNKSRHVSVKCKANGCPWFIVASKLSTTHLFRIKKMNGTHTCGAGTSTGNRPHASIKFLASIAKEKLQSTPNYKPMEIVDEIRRELGIEVRYAQAWRGIETAREELMGSSKEAYNQLPWLCEKIVESNPGSVATLVTRENLSFHCMFVAFHASLYGYQNGCRPLLFLDSLTLKSKYPGELLTATALDGNNSIFPVAFAIVDELSNDNWHWFLVQLQAVLSASQSITFVADRKYGISDSLPQIFKGCYHGYCLHYLTEDLKDELKGRFTPEVVRVIVAEFSNAAYASTVEGFKKCFETIKNISPEAYEWVLQSDPEHWANAFFKGARYNHVKSDIAQLFYYSVSEAPALPIIQVVETLRRKMMELIHTRREDSDQWSSRLTPSQEEKLQKDALNSRSFEVLFSHGSTYEIRDTMGIINVVNLDHWDCSCREWQIAGLPCLHALAVIEHTGKNVYDYCSEYFTIKTFRSTYLESINPVPPLDRSMNRESSPVHVRPPCIRRPSGRPKEARIQSEGVVQRPIHCSKCKQPGHNKVTCKNSS